MERTDRIDDSRLFRSTTTALSDVRDFVSHHASSFGFSDREVNEIMLAVDEACTNVIKHAYKGKPDGEFGVSIIGVGGEFQVVVRDWGDSFNPAEVPIPNIREKSKKHKAGGLGIFLMRKLMDTVEYRGKDAANEVRLVRHLKNDQGS